MLPQGISLESSSKTQLIGPVEGKQLMGRRALQRSNNGTILRYKLQPKRKHIII